MTITLFVGAGHRAGPGISTQLLREGAVTLPYAQYRQPITLFVGAGLRAGPGISTQLLQEGAVTLPYDIKTLSLFLHY